MQFMYNNYKNGVITVSVLIHHYFARNTWKQLIVKNDDKIIIKFVVISYGTFNLFIIP